MAKKIYKYPTGVVIPEGATYLNTVIQKREFSRKNTGDGWARCWYVWHYFLVEEKSPK